MIRRYPMVPVIGSGQQRLQPVPVEQVAEAFARAVELEATVKQTYEVGGPERRDHGPARWISSAPRSAGRECARCTCRSASCVPSPR